MGAGALDRRVQFRRATLTDDGFGMVETWADHGAPVWAEKVDVSDGERWRAGQVQAQITTRFKVRWTSFTAGLTAKDRLVCDGLTYDVTGSKEVGARRTRLEITAAARADLPVVVAAGVPFIPAGSTGLVTADGRQFLVRAA